MMHSCQAAKEVLRRHLGPEVRPATSVVPRQGNLRAHEAYALAIPEGEIMNGNLSFRVATQAPASTIPEAPGCPNPNWTETIDDLAFNNATIVVEQPPGTVVLTVVCTFASPTEDGGVPPRGRYMHGKLMRRDTRA